MPCCSSWGRWSTSCTAGAGGRRICCRPRPRALDEVESGLPEPPTARRCPARTASPRRSRASSSASNAASRSGAAVPPRPRRRTPLLALAALIALFGAAAAGFAVSELTSDDDGAGNGVAEPAAAAARAADTPSGGVAGASQSGDDGPVALAAWPDDVAAYTVILVTSSDEAGARKVAWDAARSGLEAGLLRSDDYADLGEGFWLVFAGRYANAARAPSAGRPSWGRATRAPTRSRSCRRTG